MSSNIRARRVGAMRTKDDLLKRKLWATADVTKEQVVRMTGVEFDGAYHAAEPATADGSQADMPLLMAWHSVEADDRSSEFIASEHYLISMDTSAAVLGDLVYLSDTTAGALTLSVTSTPVGWVQFVAVEGHVWFSPLEARTAVAAGDLDNYRPDVDLTWETTIAGGDGDVHVDGSAGNDTTGDGTPSKPYRNIDAAILDIPHNRSATALRAVTVVLDTPGIAYTIPTHLEALSLITIKGTLPAATESGAITVVNTTTTEAGVWIDTDIAYAAEKLTGYLVKYASGKYGQVAATYDDGGGFCSIFTTQNVNGTAYDTLLPTEAVEFWAPSSLCRVASSNSGGNGTNFNQMDNFKITFCQLTSISGTGKFVFYQSRATLKNCHIGSDIGRVYVNNGTLILDNCYVNPDGEGQEFGQVGAGPQSVLQLRGGTVFDGYNAVAGNQYPIAATGGARVLTSGPLIFRRCKPISLANGAQIDYADGYNAEVSWYFTDHVSGDSVVVVTLRDSGVHVSGTIPDIHGDALDGGTILVYAKAPARLYLGRGTDVVIAGKAGGYNFTLTDGSDYSSGNAYDDSFIRMDRTRAYAANPGTTWGPNLKEPTGGNQTITIDWSRGRSQVYDFSDASNNTSTISWLFPDNGEVGGWATLEIIQATTLGHSWAASFLWAGGVAPTLSANSGERDILRFYYTGLEWIGEAVALDVQ